LPSFIKPKNRTINQSCLLHLHNIDLSSLSIFICHLSLSLSLAWMVALSPSLFTFSQLLPASLISFQKHTNLTPTGASDLSKLTACGLSTDGNWCSRTHLVITGWRVYLSKSVILLLITLRSEEISKKVCVCLCVNAH